MAELLQYTITGISVGMVYALIALSFVLIWKSSSVANLALGQIVLVSAWFNYSMFMHPRAAGILVLYCWLSFSPLSSAG